LKILPPTLRKSYRYLAFEIICEVPAARETLLRELFSSASSLLGDMVSSQCEIRLLDYNYPFGIIRCLRGTEDLTRALLATINTIEGNSALVHVLGVSGTIRAATSKYIEGREAYTQTGKYK
jgi:ribonuclease P/MRP protein subunit POP5